MISNKFSLNSHLFSNVSKNLNHQSRSGPVPYFAIGLNKSAVVLRYDAIHTASYTIDILLIRYSLSCNFLRTCLKFEFETCWNSRGSLGNFFR